MTAGSDKQAFLMEGFDIPRRTVACARTIQTSPAYTARLAAATGIQAFAAVLAYHPSHDDSKKHVATLELASESCIAKPLGERPPTRLPSLRFRASVPIPFTPVCLPTYARCTAYVAMAYAATHSYGLRNLACRALRECGRRRLGSR